MPTVNDAARITTSSRAVWRTCGGCGVLSALRPETNKCAGCDRPVDTVKPPAPDGWDLVNQYAVTMGRIQAWADMSYVSDAERLDKIRRFLAELESFQAAQRTAAEVCR